jgi:tripartite-type tricarboxylate transporter receptor subunit TctC
MKQSMRIVLASGCAQMTLGTATAFAQEWQPDRPINLIVPWGAGGSTDQVTRVTAPILAEALGVEVVVVNQPGASGAIGTQEVLNAPRDGYTWTANAIANNATYSVTGLLEGTNIDDWHIYLSVANVPVVSVPADSEFEDFGQLLEALQTRGSEITVATELIRGDRLRALAVLSDKPLELDGVDPIPPITNWLPDMPLAPDYFGIFIPAGVPDEVIATMDKIWAEQVMNSEEIKTYAENFGAVFAPSYGEEARALAMPVVILEACSSVERGEAVNDPSTIGIDCETRTEVGM